MVTAVPSRFAVLSIDDDECKPKKSQKTLSAGKSSAKKQPDKPKRQVQQPKKEEKKKSNKGKKKKGSNEDQQWEQWKQKDSMAVEETYEQELHQAILLSKLAYEAQLETTGKCEKEQENVSKGHGSKKTKKSTMSLEEFNNLGTATSSQAPISTSNLQESKSKDCDAEFFDRIDKETKKEINKSKEKDILQARFNQVDDNITSAQLRVQVEQRDLLIEELRSEVTTLKEELTQVKNRNKKLYQILSHGEMKDKASVLAEVAKLQEIRDELTLEVASLHAQLEQERSKTRASSTETKTTKQNIKKRPACENA